MNIRILFVALCQMERLLFHIDTDSEGKANRQTISKFRFLWINDVSEGIGKSLL